MDSLHPRATVWCSSLRTQQDRDGLGTSAIPWMTAGFSMAFFAPLLGNSNQAIWLSKVEPDVQGRVFASRFLIARITSPIGLAIAAPLADEVFEPAMQPNGMLANVFGGIFGTGEGAGMALQYTLFSLCGVAIRLGSYAFPVLRGRLKSFNCYASL